MLTHLKRIKLWIRFVLGILIIVCAGVILWNLFQGSLLKSNSSMEHSDTSEDSEGFELSYSKGNRKVYRASIGSFAVNKAKLGPFAIGPLNVARIENVTIDMYTEGLLSEADQDRNNSKLDTFRIDHLESLFGKIKENAVFRRRKIGIVDVNEISLNLWEAEKKVFNISSDRLTMDRRTGDVIFTGHASLDAAENGSIIAHKIRWVRKSSLFRIEDAYILTRGNDRKEGNGLETDHLLKKIKYEVKSDS
ncbi:MAG: hypothetical protein JXR49_18690 [Acidobacteria bacterium]|nr:hypothetical protein [Acidobacteriota bacterium]